MLMRCLPAGAMKWLCGRQRVKRELLPMPSISLVVRGTQLWPPVPLPLLELPVLELLLALALDESLAEEAWPHEKVREPV